MRVTDMIKKLSSPPSPIIWPKELQNAALPQTPSAAPESMNAMPLEPPVTEADEGATAEIVPVAPEVTAEAPVETPENKVDEGVVDVSQETAPLPVQPSADSGAPISENVGVPAGAIWKDGDTGLGRMWQAVQDFLQNVRANRVPDPAAVITTAGIMIESLGKNDDLVKVLFVKKESGDLASRLIDVAIVAAKIGLALRYDSIKMQELVLCALLHDVGMLRVSESIVNKKGKLDEEELAEIRKHPQYGMEILKEIKGLPPVVAEVAYQEQEREDGSGYPLGLSGKSIHEYAKIIGLAVLFTAMLQPRPQRARRIPFEIIKEIIDHNKAQFPLYLIRILIDELALFPTGLYVKLNTGEIGKVLRASRLAPLRPVIEIVRDAYGRPPQERREYDLMKEHILRIEDAFFEIT